MNKKLDKKVTLITGSNRGLGLATLKLFSQNGSDIIACSRKKNDLFEDEINAISKKYKNKIVPIYFDLSNESEIKDAFEKIKKNYSNIDILINNAGINQISLFQMTKLSDIKMIFETNFFSVLSLTQKVLKILKKNNYSKIINISSNAATECDQGRAAYASSKSALLSFTKVLSKELGPYKICVNAVAPGLVNTDMIKSGLSEKVLEEAIKKHH